MIREKKEKKLMYFECVSLFGHYKAVAPDKHIQLSQWLFSFEHKNAVEAIRNTKDKDVRHYLKSRLPCITPSGCFHKRNHAGLIQHSGFICIDIDKKDNPNIEDWEKYKKKISDIEGLYYTGLSTSGEGLYMLFKIKYPNKHSEHFSALTHDLRGRGLIADEACKDITRLRGASYDPNPYFNPDTNVYSRFAAMYTAQKDEPISTIDYNTDSLIQELIAEICKNKIDITDKYKDWFAIGQSLASGYGEKGRSLFHIVSSQSHKYNMKQCDKQYDHCLQNCSYVSIKTFLWHCKENGIYI